MLHFSPQRRDRLGFNNEDDTYTGGSALKKILQVADNEAADD